MNLVSIRFPVPLSVNLVRIRTPVPPHPLPSPQGEGERFARAKSSGVHGFKERKLLLGKSHPRPLPPLAPLGRGRARWPNLWFQCASKKTSRLSKEHGAYADSPGERLAASQLFETLDHHAPKRRGLPFEGSVPPHPSPAPLGRGRSFAAVRQKPSAIFKESAKWARFTIRTVRSPSPLPSP